MPPAIGAAISNVLDAFKRRKKTNNEYIVAPHNTLLVMCLAHYRPCPPFFLCQFNLDAANFSENYNMSQTFVICVSVRNRAHMEPKSTQQQVLSKLGWEPAQTTLLFYDKSLNKKKRKKNVHRNKKKQ